jgi:hypothetical protein
VWSDDPVTPMLNAKGAYNLVMSRLDAASLPQIGGPPFTRQTRRSECEHQSNRTDLVLSHR